MSILQAKCEVWQRLSGKTQADLSGKHKVSLVVPKVCEGVRNAKGELMPLCMPCKAKAKAREK